MAGAASMSAGWEYGSLAAGEERVLSALLEALPDAVAILEDGNIVRVNGEFERLFGYAAGECAGLNLDELLVPEGRLHENEILLHSVATEARATMETMRRVRGGGLVDVRVAVARFGDSGRGLLVSYCDIRQEKAAEARLQHMSLHDGLTGLPNRGLFLDRLSLTMARLKRRPDRSFAVLFLDLDGFKHVNDTLGHAAGDLLLLTMATRLRECVRPQDTVARLGGDEFALLLDETAAAEDAGLVAERIQRAVAKVVEVGAESALVTASIGIALGSKEYTAAAEILADADRAMYVAKGRGKARHEVCERTWGGE